MHSTAENYLTMEDIQIGKKFRAGPVTVTHEAIIDFAQKFDPQDFHTDAVKAKDTVFGELVASGWHTASLTMRMILEATPKTKGGLIGRGVEKISWPRPVRPGDQLSLEIEVLDLRESGKTPDRGIMRTKNTTFNQKNEVVMEMETIVFVPRRR